MTLGRNGTASLTVDNVFATPLLQSPLALGADCVVYSATKHVDGQGRCLGGAVLGRKDILEPVYGFLRTAGVTLLMAIWWATEAMPLAATALVHGLTVVTRNTAYFEPMGVKLFNPWIAAED